MLALRGLLMLPAGYLHSYDSLLPMAFCSLRSRDEPTRAVCPARRAQRCPKLPAALRPGVVSVERWHGGRQQNLTCATLRRSTPVSDVGFNRPLRRFQNRHFTRRGTGLAATSVARGSQSCYISKLTHPSPTSRIDRLPPGHASPPLREARHVHAHNSYRQEHS